MNIFIYDNTFEGLLTAIYDGFYSKIPPESIYGNGELYPPLLLGAIINITTEEVKFNKVKDAIINKIDILCLKKIYMVYLSNYTDKGIIIFKYLKTAFKLGKNAHLFLNLDEVRIIDNINRQVSLEIYYQYN